MKPKIAYRFLLITTPQQHNQILPWIQRNVKTENSFNLLDVSSKYSALGVFGSSSKELLQGLTLTSLEHFSTGSFKVMRQNVMCLFRNGLGSKMSIFGTSKMKLRNKTEKKWRR